MKESPLTIKSYHFAIRVVNLYRYLIESKREYVLSKQCLRSGTAAGALIHEAEFAQSKKDFANKLSIAAKEANETIYWLRLMHETDIIDQHEFSSISQDARELLRLLTASIITTKKSISKTI